MASIWTPEYLLSLFFAVALGNVLAVCVHTFTWWLRYKTIPRIVMAFLGASALLLFLSGAGLLIYIFGDGLGFGLDGDAPPPPSNWKIKAAFNFLIIVLITCGFIGFIGAIQMRQIPARWYIASLCFSFELVFALISFWAVRMLHAVPSSGGIRLTYKYEFVNIFAIAFIASLLLLALARPLFLVVLKYIGRQVKAIPINAEHIS